MGKPQKRQSKAAPQREITPGQQTWTATEDDFKAGLSGVGVPQLNQGEGSAKARRLKPGHRADTAGRRTKYTKKR